MSGWLVKDFQDAAAYAKVLGDQAGETCFGHVATELNIIGAGVPRSIELATDYEHLWGIHLFVTKLKADPDCQAVCGRTSQMLGLLGFKIAPSLCDAFNALP